MDAKALTPVDLFGGRVSYEVPPFQRPYVWTEEDQWQPLWDDIARVAETVLATSDDKSARAALGSHFLGAVVVKQLQSGAGDPARLSVIDGQQRLTTLQLVLDAAQLVMAEVDSLDVSESIYELVVNDSKRFRSSHKRFKLWPSRVDRDAFELVMDSADSISPALDDSRIVRAHRFFVDAMRQWARGVGEEDNPFTTEQRVAALAAVLQQHLQIVAIDLASSDDDQLIFETLNDRGTPLLAADLIKNYVFQQCDEIGADVDTWGEKYWEDFDKDWWRNEIAQGRQLRSRIDLFLQYWLTMMVKEEIPTDKVFDQFRKHASEHLGSVREAEAFLARLRSDADTFREFAQLDPFTAQGSFYSRVVEALELGVFIRSCSGSSRTLVQGRMSKAIEHSVPLRAGL
jgi:hypothetical protein